MRYAKHIGARCEVCQQISLRAMKQKAMKRAGLCSRCARGERLTEDEQQAQARAVEPARMIPLTAQQLIEEWKR